MEQQLKAVKKTLAGGEQELSEDELDMSPKFCSNCKEENPPVAKFCCHCGTNEFIKGGVNANQANESPLKSNQPSQAKDRARIRELEKQLTGLSAADTQEKYGASRSHARTSSAPAAGRGPANTGTTFRLPATLRDALGDGMYREIEAHLGHVDVPDQATDPFPTRHTAYTAKKQTPIPPGDEVDDDVEVDLESPHIIFFPHKWHTLASDNAWARKQLTDMLRQELGCHQPKLFHQQEHLLKVLNFLLKEEVLNAYKNICHRLHFLHYLDNHSLKAAVHYHKQLEGETKPSYFKYAEMSTAVQEEHGKRQYTGKESQFITAQGAGKDDSKEAEESKYAGGHRRGGRGRNGKQKGFPRRQGWQG